MHIVVDTNVLISGHITPAGKSGGIVEMLLRGEIRAAFDDRVLSEYATVLRRPNFGIDEADAAEVLVSIRKLGRTILPDRSAMRLPDENDRCFYECALQCDTGILVTGNKTHFPAGVCKGVQVMSPGEFLDWYDARLRARVSS